MNTKELKAKIKNLGYGAKDFSVKSAGLYTDVKLVVKSKNPSHRGQDFAKIEKLMPYGSILVYDSENSTQDWED